MLSLTGTTTSSSVRRSSRLRSPPPRSSRPRPTRRGTLRLPLNDDVPSSFQDVDATTRKLRVSILPTSLKTL